MNKSISLALIALFWLCQAAFALDENDGLARQMREIAENGPVRGVEFNLAETVVDRKSKNPTAIEYFGYQGSEEKITDGTEVLRGRYGTEVKLSRRRDLDSKQFTCFDTLSSNGTVSRIWIDLASVRKNEFPRCYMYKTWGNFEAKKN